MGLEELIVAVLGTLLSDFLKDFGVPLAEDLISGKVRAAPVEVHDAIPDEQTDDAVAAAIGDDIAAGLVE